MKPIDVTKLSVMMLLEYFIWGAWYVTMGTYMSEFLGASGTQIGAAYSALAIATIFSPFFVGMVADRFFAAQKIMGILHILGAGLLFFATEVTDNTTFYWVILFYSLLYMPTIALSNSIAFHQMSDPGKQFPWIRVFGTIGWIVAGLMIAALSIEKTPATFHMAAVASLSLGVLSFALPNTPPKGKVSASSDNALRKDAFVLLQINPRQAGIIAALLVAIPLVMYYGLADVLFNMAGGSNPLSRTATALLSEILFILTIPLFSRSKDKSYLVFFVAAILVCIPLSFYYGFANLFLNEIGMENAAGKMVLGQVSEALFILAIPFLFNRIGVKRMLILGMTAWILRYICFAYGNTDANLWMLYAGIILHGICYDFFFVTGYMYTEKKAGEKIKNAAQGLFTFATYGMGMVIGSLFSGSVSDYYKVNGQFQWTQIWYVPAFIAIFVLVYFLAFFREKKEISQAA
jgi:MFS family permease